MQRMWLRERYGKEERYDRATCGERAVLSERERYGKGV